MLGTSVQVGEDDDAILSPQAAHVLLQTNKITSISGRVYLCNKADQKLFHFDVHCLSGHITIISFLTLSWLSAKA